MIILNVNSSFRQLPIEFVNKCPHMQETLSKMLTSEHTKAMPIVAKSHSCTLSNILSAQSGYTSTTKESSEASSTIFLAATGSIDPLDLNVNPPARMCDAHDYIRKSSMKNMLKRLFLNSFTKMIIFQYVVNVCS